jgi:hypothetical protein
MRINDETRVFYEDEIFPPTILFTLLLDESFSQWRREGVRGGAIAPGRQREGAPKEGDKKIFLMMERVKGATEA